VMMRRVREGRTEGIWLEGLKEEGRGPSVGSSMYDGRVDGDGDRSSQYSYLEG